MEKKTVGHAPPDKVKSERMDIYIGDLQKRLHQVRNRYDTIFIECCDILKNIQEVSTETITKQQEIGRIIKEFEEIGMKGFTKDIGLKKALIQKAGEVRRIREKFESDIQNHLSDALHSQTSNYEVEKNCVRYTADRADKRSRETAPGCEITKEESYYKMLSESGRMTRYQE